MKEEIIEEHFEDLLFPRLSGVWIDGEAHQEVRSSAEIVLIRHSIRIIYKLSRIECVYDVLVLFLLRMGLQIGPQIGHEIDQKWYDKAVFFLALVDDVEYLGQVFSEYVERV